MLFRSGEIEDIQVQAAERRQIGDSGVFEIKRCQRTKFVQRREIPELFAPGEIEEAERHPGEQCEVLDLRAAEIEREKAVLAEGEALFERLLGGDRQVFKPREQ